MFFQTHRCKFSGHDAQQVRQHRARRALDSQPAVRVARVLRTALGFRMGPFKEGWTEADVEAVLSRGVPDEILYIPIVVGMNSDCVDRIWAESMCLALANHPHTQTRCNAMTGLGHIARICGELSQDTVLPAISAALKDANEQVRGYAIGAACDIHHYLGVVVPGYDSDHTEEHYEKLRNAAEFLMKQAEYGNET